jgi:hypothetical protein
VDVGGTMVATRPRPCPPQLISCIDWNLIDWGKKLFLKNKE